MATKDNDEMNLEIHTKVTELNLCIEELDLKINKLMTHEDTTKSDDEVEALKAGIEALKKDQEDVKKRFNDFIMQFYQSDDLENLPVLTNIDEGFEDLKTKIEGYKEEEEDVNKRFNELMIEFSITKDFGGLGISTGTGAQKEEDNVTDFVQSGHSSDADLEGSNVTEGHEQDMPVLISDSEESEEETEECEKSEGDVKSRFLQKFWGADSSDDQEEVSSDTEDLSTNIPGLEQEMHELMHGSGKSKGSKKEGGYVKKLNEAQKSRNSRLEKVISYQSGYIDLNAYTSIKGLKGKIYGLKHEERKSKATLIEYGQSDNVDLGVCTNLEGLEQKMNALMHESKEGLEKDQHDLNKRLKEWLKECDESDEEWKALKAIKAQEIELAIKLSQQLVNQMLLMSDWKEVLAKFLEVKSLLEWVIEDETSLLVNWIISVMELVNKEVEKMKESEKVKSVSLEGSSVNMEETEQKGSFYDESQIDQFFDQFLKEVLRLEYIMKHIGLPESQMLKKEVLASLKAGLEQCQKELEDIEMKQNELKVMSSLIFGSDESERREIWKRTVELKIKEFWNGSEEADEENKQRE